MHPAFQRRLEGDLFHVFFPAQNCPVQMRGGPARRHGIGEKFRQFFRGGRRVVVATCAKRRELSALVVEYQITVHHRAHAERRKFRNGRAVARENVVREFFVRVLHPRDDVCERVRPDPVLEFVFPVVAARRQRLVVLADEHRLDPRGAEFDAERTAARFYDIFYIFHHGFLP